MHWSNFNTLLVICQIQQLHLGTHCPCFLQDHLHLHQHPMMCFVCCTLCRTACYSPARLGCRCAAQALVVAAHAAVAVMSGDFSPTAHSMLNAQAKGIYDLDFLRGWSAHVRDVDHRCASMCEFHAHSGDAIQVRASTGRRTGVER